MYPSLFETPGVTIFSSLGALVMLALDEMFEGNFRGVGEMSVCVVCGNI